MKQTLLITLMLIALPSLVFAESDVLSQLDRNKYSSFKTIESFKIIKCIFRGNGAEKNGLSKEDLTDFIRLKFENNMAGFPYKEMTDFEWQLMTRNEFPTKGQVWVYVWVVGTDYPLACHISLKAGSFDEGDQYTDAVLGVGAKEHLSRLVKDHINQMIERFAVKFFEVRNEL